MKKQALEIGDIVDGPNRESLFDALRLAENKIFLNFKFYTKKGEIIFKAFIHSIEKIPPFLGVEGDDWIIELSIKSKNKAKNYWRGFYSTSSRKGRQRMNDSVPDCLLLK